MLEKVLFLYIGIEKRGPKYLAPNNHMINNHIFLCGCRSI